MLALRLVIRSVLLCGILAACQPKNEGSSIEFRVPVGTAIVGIDTVEEEVKTTGTVRAPEVMSLIAMTGGLLKIAMGHEGRFVEGDMVKEGEVIANVTGEDARLATKMRLVEEKIKVARDNLNATSVMYKKKLVSISDYGRAKSEYEDALHAYEQSVHSQSRNKIVAPIDGVIIELARDGSGIRMAGGQLIGAGQVVVRIAPLDSLIIDVNVVSKDIARVEPGLKARANYHAWRDRQFEGHVLRLAPTLNEKTRSLRAEIEVNNDDGLLKPGMFVEVALVAERREKVPVVPRSALTLRGGRRVVFVVSGQRVERREVVLGIGDDNRVEVRKGLAGGEQIVVQGLETLSDEMPVRVTSNESVSIAGGDLPQ